MNHEKETYTSGICILVEHVMKLDQHEQIQYKFEPEVLAS